MKLNPLNHFIEREQEMIDTIKVLVGMETPSPNKPACDRLADWLQGQFTALGGQVERVSQEDRGDHLIARWGEGHGGVLLLAHYDTVWPIGTLDELPFRVEDGKLYGPGAFDMKGGIALGIHALRAIKELSLDHPRITFLATSDEETGSRTSRPLLEAEAKQHDRVLVLEPAAPGGRLKIARKGTAMYDVAMKGIPAHAGNDPEKGASAIVAMADFITAAQALANLDVGTTVSVGTVAGGTAGNVIPEHAEAVVDVRFTSMDEAERVDTAIRAFRPNDSRVTCRVSGGINRPALEFTAQNQTLFELARTRGAELGITVEGTKVGGASDGNFTSALGIPTLDGMGVVGNGAHARHEHLVVAQLPKKAALLTRLLTAD